MGIKSQISLGLGAIILFFGLIMFFSAFTTIGAGQRGVVTVWDAVTGEILGEGLHWVNPISTNVIEMDTQVQKEETTSGAASKDLQTVQAQIAVNFHLDAGKVHLLYQEVGREYGTKIIAPAVQETVKAVTAQFTAEELITKREEVKDKMKNILVDKLVTKYIVLDDVLITNFDFSASFNAAIEAKQTAQQDALRAKNELEKIKLEGEQRVVQATAEAEAIRIQAQAITQQGGEDYVQLKTIEKWDGRGCTQYCGLETAPGLLISR